MTGEPTHTASETVPRAPIIVWKSILFCCQLCSTRYAAFRIKNCLKAPLQSTHMVPRALVISIIVWKVKYLLSFFVGYVQPVYTAVRIKNCLKSTSASKIATMKNTDDFRYEGKPSRAIDTFCCQQIRMGDKEGHWWVHEECIVHTAVCQKALIGQKRRLTMIKSSQ